MEIRDSVVTPSATDALMVEPELVRQVRALGEQGWGSKRIAREVGIARNTGEALPAGT